MADANVSLETKWGVISSNIKELVSLQQYKTWFKSIRLHSNSHDSYVFSVPTKFLKDWISNYYMDVLHKAIHRATGKAGKVSLCLDASLRLNTGNPELNTGNPVDQKETAEGEGSGLSDMNGFDSEKSSDANPFKIDSPLDSPEPDSSGTEYTRSDNGKLPERGLSRKGTDAQDNSNLESSNLENPNLPNQARDRKTSLSNARVQKNRAFRCVDGFYLNPINLFKNFIIGPCNQLSYAASLAVSENLSETYNPLFLHGASGLGKTHLLQAICHKLLERNPSSRILFLSCETFINHFISAVEKRDLSRFRTKYRQIDILLIDDIHLLANKERTQEEFFHTFNTLFNSGKQIVLTSDSFPSDIPTLEERLVSRFKCGLVTQVYPPDFETRSAILKMKARQRNVNLPNEVISFLAESVDTNIRELEGAVTKVTGYATLMNQKLDLDMAYEAMKDVIKKKTRIVSIDTIAKNITEKFSVKLSDLQSKKRTKSIAMPRQIAMYIVKKMTSHSLQEIGAYFGGRDHSTVLHAYNKILNKVTADEGFKELIEELVKESTACN